MDIEWDQIEKAWVNAITRAIVSITTKNPDECFYAGAFWLLYGDYSSILVPVFGMNSENTDPSIRWHPPNWRWDIINDAVDEVKPLYEPLLEIDVDDKTFEAMWNQHISMLASASKNITSLVRSNKLDINISATTPNFFVGIIDFSYGDEATDYLNRSVDEETIKTSGILED
jgi:hypothetical protein